MPSHRAKEGLKSRKATSLNVGSSAGAGFRRARLIIKTMGLNVRSSAGAGFRRARLIIKTMGLNVRSSAGGGFCRARRADTQIRPTKKERYA